MRKYNSALMASTAFLACLEPLSAHIVVVDLDSTTPGVQVTRAVTPGQIFEIELVLITDATNPVSAIGLATMWNDTAGVLDQVSAPVASSGATFFGFPSRHISDSTTVVIDDPMSTLGLSPFGIGIGGPYMDGDGGVGIYGDILSVTPGSNLPLWRTKFEATGAVGEESFIMPFGIIDVASSPAVALPLISTTGEEFFDYGVMGTGGVGAFSSVRNRGGLVEIVAVPEPSAWSTVLLFCGLSLLRRERS